MPEWMTGQNLTTVVVVLLALWEAFKAIAPKTATKIDDNIVDAVGDAKEWARGSSPHAWAIAELLAAQGAIPKAQKSAAFALKLREAYIEATGKVLPDKALKEAELVAAGLSASDKLNRLPAPSAIAIPSDPQPGPASS
jgi:hypothetical protein